MRPHSTAPPSSPLKTVHREVQWSSRKIREIWLDLLALLWPCACALCGVPDRDLCTECTTALRGAVGRFERRRTASGGEVWVHGSYDGALRALLVLYKHAGRVALAKPLGALLAGPLEAALRTSDGHAPVLVVPVVSRPRRVRERGFRHVDMLVRHALDRSRARGSPSAILIRGALQALPGRSGQVGLHATQRLRNAALICVPRHMKGRLRGREVLLVDDIITTGATVDAAAQALAAVGARVLGSVTLAAAERRDQTQTETQQKRFSAEVEVNMR